MTNPPRKLTGGGSPSTQQRPFRRRVLGRARRRPRTRRRAILGQALLLGTGCRRPCSFVPFPSFVRQVQLRDLLDRFAVPPGLGTVDEQQAAKRALYGK